MRGTTLSLVLLAAVLSAVVTACGGSGGSTPGGAADEASTLAAFLDSPEAGSAPRWVEDRLAENDGVDTILLVGTTDHGVGLNRVSFAVVRPDGRLVQAPRAAVYFAPEDSPDDLRVAEATLVSLGAHTHPPGTPSHDHEGETDLYVTHLDLPEPGRYWLVVEPEGEPIQGAGGLEVRERTVSPAVGSRAIPSDNPTLADAPAGEITTASPPDSGLLRYSVKESLEDGVPFVVAFATPKFCQTRLCGPTVEIVDEVRRRLEGTGVRFIHIEIFEQNDPQLGPNRWVREWNLLTEPWVFLVDREGVIRARFENSVSADELESAVREHLLGNG